MRASPFLVCCCLALGCSARVSPPSETRAIRPARIVNGQDEGGWPAVGALTAVSPGLGYQGAFCTATLVAPQWVLTAAHCLTGNGELEVFPQTTSFLVGTNANPKSAQGPIAGTLYAADAFVIHPDFEPVYNANDLGLVHLAQPVAGVPPVPVSGSFLNAVGADVLYVGFGATEGITHADSGIKRSATAAITWIYDLVYTSDYAGAGTCFGDSGGPGLLQLDGEWRMVGVNSALSGCPAGATDCPPDPCHTTSVVTRTDAYATWIAGVIGSPPPSCQTDPDVCFCAAACQAGGTCDNAACQTLDCAAAYDCLGACSPGDGPCQIDCHTATTPAAKDALTALQQCLVTSCPGLDGSAFQECVAASCAGPVATCFPIGVGPLACQAVYDCIVACPADNTCPLDCYAQGTAQAQAELDALLGCFDAMCAGLEGAAFSQCATDKCAAAVATCFPPVTGSLTCEGIQACFGDCADDDSECIQTCFDGGTAEAQATSNAMASCFGQFCPGIADSAAWLACVQSHCGEAIDACFPPALCPINGGGCPAGEACYPTPTGATDCFGSSGGALGAACATGTATLPCGDGLLCSGGICQAACTLPQHCGPDATCQVPAFVDAPGIGICVCVDADADGACATVDCDDTDKTVHPGAAEACNQKDDDCDGATDEGCPPDGADDAGGPPGSADATDADAGGPPTVGAVDEPSPPADAVTGPDTPDAASGAADVPAPLADASATDDAGRADVTAPVAVDAQTGGLDASAAAEGASKAPAVAPPASDAAGCHAGGPGGPSPASAALILTLAWLGLRVRRRQRSGGA